ncbi:Obg-like ATPase 1 [Anthophora retusa]
MCDETLRNGKDESTDDRDQFYVNSSFIVKKSFLKFIKGHPREEYIPPWPEPHGCVYPKASASYAYHEDINPFTRFPAKCTSRKYGSIQPHFESPKEPFTIRDPYNETEAKKKYLGSRPTCFVILGKPDLNTTKLATMIADMWNCILISPLALINQEIERASEKGKLMRDILKTGECLGPEIVMNIIANRLDKRDVFHRGYVIEGLPLVPNGMLDYSSYSTISSEELNPQVISEMTMKLFDSSFHRICSTANELQKTSISCVRDSKNKICKARPDYERFISSQIEDIFTTWPLKPSIIVYAMCPDADLVRKRELFRIDPITGRTIDTSLTDISTNIETLLSHDRMHNGINVSYELYQELMTEERILDEYQRKYLLKRLSDNVFNVEAQCALYKRLAMPTIEKWILLHNPQNVIRVDGRTAVSLMFKSIVARLRILAAPRVILAKRFIDPSALEFKGESPLPIEDFEGKSNEEAFQELSNRETVSPLFPWRLSIWNFLCPVELARGRTVEGMAKYAVHFMDKIFYLSSNEAANLFVENPRTFLFPFSPRPTCKVVVFGPHYSGKSDLCKNLARVLRGTIINVNEIENSLRNIDSVASFYSPTYMDVGEKTSMIIKAIENIPKEEIDIDVWRDGGYIVDGMYPNIDCWKSMVEESDIIFEDAILLYDQDPYNFLLSKWQSIHDIDEYEGEYMQDEVGDEEEEEKQGLVEYIRHIQKFDMDWRVLREKIEESCRHLITCDIGKINDVSKYIIDQIKDRYVDKARIMTEEEKEREKDLAEYIAMSDTENIEEEEEEGDRETTGFDSKEDNRRFGDTNLYCPVALLKYNIFWKGKEDFSAIFMNKIYHLSSAEAVEEFLRSPQSLNLPFKKPLLTIPPVRVSIIGPTGSGKSTLANAISREYGLVHIDYFNNFTVYMKSRAMPETSHKDILIAPENLMDEVELPEDLSSMMYNYDTATVQTFVKHYWKSGSVLPDKILKECLLDYFEGLYNLHGTVLDQFPSCKEDVEVAIRKYTVPDIVIELRCDKDTAFERAIPGLISSWRTQLEEKKRNEELRYKEALEEYEINREIWILKMLHRKPSVLRENDEEEEYYDYIDDDDFEETDLNRFEAEEMWAEENPEPVLFTDWEDLQTAQQRIEQEFLNRYETDSQKIDDIRIALENETIPYVTVDAVENARDLLLRVMMILDPYIRRDGSILEKMYTVDPETADALLDRGYYFPSSFGRWCPVQLHRNKIPLQMFLPLEAQQEIHPVIHRQFVYFLGSKDAQLKFIKNPFKYLEQDSCAPAIPFRISIIGPPKCGKTTLARQFARKYGLKVVTRGSALRHIVKSFPWTESARSAESRLRAGHIAPVECVYRAVEMYSIDPTSVSQGFVLDGFPLNRKEYEELTFLGLQPMITFDLKANLDFCLNCLSLESNEEKYPLNFSNAFFMRRYAVWELDQESFRRWLKNFAQSLVELDAAKCKWYVWTRADEEVCSRYTIIREYFRQSDYDKVHSLKYMNVSPYEFKRRQTRYESYCPLCLYRENTMKLSGPPPEHEGMVQFREHFYWICPRHMNDFIRDPEKHLPPINTAHLPQDRPRILTETIDFEHPCFTRRLQVKGFCLTTYVDNLPCRKLVAGKRTIGIEYEENIYLFCTEECRDRFLAQPEKYASVKIKFLRTLSPVNLDSLPDLGFLEQTVVKLIIKAVNQISVIRPKIPARRVPVPDERYDYLCEYFKPVSKVPAFLNVVDIAGLVKGAAEGQGLGNSFLSHINACDGIFHLCRAFDDDDVTHVEGDVDPVRDLEIISEELRLKDIEFLNVHLEKLEKLVVRGNDKKLKPEYDTLLKVKGVMVDEKRHIRFADWSATDIEVLNKYLFLTSKPVIYLINMSKQDYIRKKNKWLGKIKEWVDKNDPGAVIIPFSGVFENTLIDMDDAERAKYLEESKATSILDRIIVKGYQALQLQYFFTAGHDEVKAWTIQKGTKAPQAAGKIHTDFEKGFIMAEVMKFDDFKNEGSEAAVKAAGKYRQQGRNYVVEDGDIIFFKFNAGAGLKDPKKK